MVRLLLNSVHSITLWLSSSCPSFSVHGDQVSILHHPEEFHQTLVSLCCKAQRRISVASLYLGTGEKEQQLVDAIQYRSKCLGASLKIKILLDALRGSRGQIKNSRTMMLPLLEQNPSCQVSLFHSPKLRGIFRALLPARYNELMGLQHIKLYIIDDDVIMSGANLSHDYFTNRQDRYVLVKNCRQLANFFDGLITILCDMSLQLSATNDVSFPHKDFHPFKGSGHLFVTELKRRIDFFYKSYVNSSQYVEDGSDTWIFPTIEVPFCGIHNDSEIARILIESVPERSRMFLASGYFNLSDQLVESILSSKSEFDLLMAHPTANGFYKSAGFSQHIPSMYTAISEQFYSQVEKANQCDRIRSFEYRRSGWTFHGKGIWLTLPEQKLPHLTVVGSSNFGVRSNLRDLESQIVIVTGNENLRKKLYAEQQHLIHFGYQISRKVFNETERKVPKWINHFLWMLKSFL